MKTLLPLAAAMLLASPAALAEPGERWEMKIEMDGSPVPMPMQSQCLPKRSGTEPPVAKQDDHRCKMVDKKQSGNRFQWKVICPDGTSEGDMTSTGDNYYGTVKTTDKSGQTTTVKMNGRKLGPCDYQDPTARMQEMMKGGRPGQMPEGMPALTPEMKAQLEAMQKRYQQRGTGQ